MIHLPEKCHNPDYEDCQPIAQMMSDEDNTGTCVGMMQERNEANDPYRKCIIGLDHEDKVWGAEQEADKRDLVDECQAIVTALSAIENVGEAELHKLLWEGEVLSHNG